MWLALRLFPGLPLTSSPPLSVRRICDARLPRRLLLRRHGGRAVGRTAAPAFSQLRRGETWCAPSTSRARSSTAR